VTKTVSWSLEVEKGIAYMEQELLNPYAHIDVSLGLGGAGNYPWFYVNAVVNNASGDVNAKEDFNEPEYLGVADAFVILGPDVPQEDEGSNHHTEFVYKNNPFEIDFSPYPMYPNPEDGEYVWRPEPPTYHFYFVGEDYPDIDPAGRPDYDKFDSYVTVID
jgi:hypothetical protein